MERWSAIECQSAKGPEYYLANRSRTVLAFSRPARKFDILRLLRALDEAGFPLRFTEGITQINFTIARKYFGWYSDCEIWIDVNRKHRFGTILRTFIHEVAHHIDYSAGDRISRGLEEERRRSGRRIHSEAARHDDEYLAHGFEAFYSGPKGRRDLRKFHPSLHRTIVALHRKHRGSR